MESDRAQSLVSLFSSDHKAESALKASYEKRLHELSAEIGRLTTQVNWLKKKSGIASDPDGTLGTP